MNATVIPASRLNDLRRRRGLIERTQLHCLCCSRAFMSAGPADRVCDVCRAAGPARWEPDLNAH